MPPRAPARSTCALILAAGQGKRMKSGRIKLLHVMAGSPMVCHVARAASELKPAMLAAVVGNQADEVIAALSALSAQCPVGGIRFVTQERQLGTAHAVLQAEPLLTGGKPGRCDLLILNGDVPLIRASTLRSLLKHHRRAGAAATVLTTEVGDPSGYGRVVRDESGALSGIVEDRDASPLQKKIREINAGLYCVDPSVVFAALKKTRRSNAQGEYYLPDLFPILRRQGRRVEAYLHRAAEEVLGVNDRADLARAAKILYSRRAAELMESGVTILDPECTYIDPDVSVGPDTVIHPMARLEGSTSIGSGCTIGALCHIVDSTLADGVVVRDMCVIAQSRLASGVVVGPFAHLRPGTQLEEGVHIGNFVEVKKSRLGRKSKANHLAYLGDAEIGERCNIGAGTITCNYDGVRKHLTTLGDEVFIGSDTQLVAPVSVGRGAYVGAGSTITKDVPEQALALSRVQQRNIEGWVTRRQEKRERERQEHEGPKARTRPKDKGARVKMRGKA
jgi:bifunctional UDP-N-acetylglucosamine pyrophosphorylase/glucosamine-1-phosphate N-acetyltransferase